MKTGGTMIFLTALCVAELIFIAALIGGREVFPPQVVELARVAEQKWASSPEKSEAVLMEVHRASESAVLLKQNQALESKLAEVTKELETRKSEISFSYGSVRDSGRFVGMTFRKMFETAAARESKEAQQRMVENQLNVLSLGPFIQDAEVFESDPASFAQFQAPLISELLGLPTEQGMEVETLLTNLKTKSLKLEEGSAEWLRLNDLAMEKVKALVPENRQQAVKPQLDFLEQYGVLVIPAYSILRSPTPTVVPQSLSSR